MLGYDKVKNQGKMGVRGDWDRKETNKLRNKANIPGNLSACDKKATGARLVYFIPFSATSVFQRKGLLKSK